MSRRWSSIAAYAAIGATTACDSEVTIHLLSDTAAITRDAAIHRPDPAVEAGGGDAAGDAQGDGEAGSSVNTPCEKLGPEVCNGADDDCDGVTDENCVYTVVWTQMPDGATLGHLTGGVTFFEPCDNGTVLTGLRIGMGGWLDQVSAVCRQIGLVSDTSQSTVRFSAALGPRLYRPLAPAMSTDSKNKLQDFLCPDGLVLSGADGTTTTVEPHYILGIRLACAPPIVTMTANGPIFDSDRTQVKTTDPIVCNGCSATQAYNFMFTIAAGQVATRVFGSDGLWVDRMGIGGSLASIVKK